MKKENPQPSYFAIIPAEVRYCNSIPANARLLFGELLALSTKQGYCWASNEYLGKLYNVNPKTISEWVKNLQEAHFIKSEVKGYNRKITILSTLRKKPTFAPPKPDSNATEKPDNSNTSISNITSGASEHPQVENYHLTSPNPFDFRVYLIGTLENSKGKNWARYFSALYIKRKGLTFKDAKSLEATIREGLWVGKKLADYTGDMEKIQSAFERAENKEYYGKKVDWDLKTVLNEIVKL